MSWDRPFDQPVSLPGQRSAKTLRQAGDYIKELPQSERDTPEWQAAMEASASGVPSVEGRLPCLYGPSQLHREPAVSLGG
jgi:hypothetical protein